MGVANISSAWIWRCLAHRSGTTANFRLARAFRVQPSAAASEAGRLLALLSRPPRKILDPPAALRACAYNRAANSSAFFSGSTLQASCDSYELCCHLPPPQKIQRENNSTRRATLSRTNTPFPAITSTPNRRHRQPQLLQRRPHHQANTESSCGLTW